jgi:hypothetical protein
MLPTSIPGPDTRPAIITDILSCGRKLMWDCQIKELVFAQIIIRAYLLFFRHHINLEINTVSLNDVRD